MTTPISKAEALAAYEGNVSALATALDITPQAIYQWPEDAPIPDLRAMKLRFVLKPSFFKHNNKQQHG